MPALMTARMRERFATDGYLVLPELVPYAITERLRGDSAVLLANILDRMLATKSPDPRVTWWRLATGQAYVLKVKPVVDRMPSAAALAAGPALTSVAAELLGTVPLLMEDKLMYKQAVTVTTDFVDLPILGDEVCKHTDAAYFAARGYRRVLTVAVCLDECTESSGALRVWPGTHRRCIDMVHTERQGPVVSDDAAPDTAAVTLLASPGTVLIWDSALVHASGPNTSGHARRLLVLGYAPAGGERS